MNIRNVMILICLIAHTRSYACDVCGTSTLNSTAWYSLMNTKLVGINYSHGNSDYADRVEEWSYNTTTRTISLSTLWQLSNSFQLEGQLPYVLNQRTYQGRVEQNHNIGDIQAGISHFARLVNDSSFSIQLKSGFLTELPLTKANPEVDSWLMQTTSSSVDIIPSIALIGSKGMVSGFVQSRMKTSLYELHDYRFGNTIQNEAGVLINAWRTSRALWSPNLGWLQEVKRTDIKENRKVHGTSYNLMFLNVGSQLTWNDMILSLNYQEPLYYKQIEKGINMNTRWTCSVNYKF